MQMRSIGKIRAGKAALRAAVLLPALGLLLSLSSMTMQAQYNGPAGDRNAGENKTKPVTTDPAVLYPPAHDFVLGQGDLVSVQVYGVSEFTSTFRVMPDGTLTLPLIGTVMVGGLNTRQASALIAKKLLDDGMVKNPQVTLNVVEAPNQVAIVAGEVHVPGLIPVVGQRTLFDVLTAAGGILPTGSHVITILRPGVPDPITVDLGSDPSRSIQSSIPIFAGDRIIVPRTGVVYTYGAFHMQSAFPLSNSTPLTLMQVCALAGGIPFEAERKDTIIIRTVGIERKEVKVNLDRVIDGKDPDPILQNDDIVYIPTNQIKAAIHAGGISTVLAATYALNYIH